MREDAESSCSENSLDQVQGSDFLEEVDGTHPRKNFKTLNTICKALFNLVPTYCLFPPFV